MSEHFTTVDPQLLEQLQVGEIVRVTETYANSQVVYRGPVRLVADRLIYLGSDGAEHAAYRDADGHANIKSVRVERLLELPDTLESAVLVKHMDREFVMVLVENPINDGMFWLHPDHVDKSSQWVLDRYVRTLYVAPPETD